MGDDDRDGSTIPVSLTPFAAPWLAAETDRLLHFAEAAAHPDGGFAWLDDDGVPQLERPRELWVTCRLTHVFALGHLLGRPGAQSLMEHGLAALAGPFRDPVHGGWYATIEGRGPTATDKRAYEHAFVILAASSAAAAGSAAGEPLLETALDVFDRRFWGETDGLCVDRWDRSWGLLEPYRGANANMHAVEAFLAAADVTGAGLWRQRALGIAERLVHGRARTHGWRLPEHYDEGWRVLPGYNARRPADPFRPFGATIGHGLEWSRLLLQLRAGGGPLWLLDDAVALFDGAVEDGWAVDGADGFVYTVDWDGVPVVRDRLHWVVAEAIAAAAALWQATGEPVYGRWYDRWWEYAAGVLIDVDRGSWRHELDSSNRPGSSVWQGKPDVYHALQATLLPRLPLTPCLSVALRDGLLDAPTGLTSSRSG